MIVHRTHAVPTPSAYAGQVEQSDHNDQYDPSRTTRIEHIDEDMGRDIATIEEYDPFINKHVFGFQLDVDGDVGTYVFKPLHQPHAYAATQQLPTQGNLVVASQQEYEKL